LQRLLQRNLILPNRSCAPFLERHSRRCKNMTRTLLMTSINFIVLFFLIDIFYTWKGKTWKTIVGRGSCVRRNYPSILTISVRGINAPTMQNVHVNHREMWHSQNYLARIGKLVYMYKQCYYTRDSYVRVAILSIRWSWQRRKDTAAMIITTTSCRASCTECRVSLKAIDTIYISSYYYNIVYKISSLTGMWPYLKPKTRVFRITLLTIILLTILVPQVITDSTIATYLST